MSKLTDTQKTQAVAYWENIIRRAEKRLPYSRTPEVTKKNIEIARRNLKIAQEA
jgi:hypothetical protein